MMRSALILALASLALATAALAEPAAPAKASAGVYSAAQAARGAEIYASTCARCHGPSLEGIDVAPALSGPKFQTNWTGQTAAALATRIRTTMPQDDPGALGLSASADLVAYILQSNGYPAGAADLPAGSQAQQAVAIDAPPAAKP